MPIIEVLRKHGVSQLQASRESGIPVQTLNEIVNGKRCPRTDTVNRLLAFVQRYEPRLTIGQLYEQCSFRRAA